MAALQYIDRGARVGMVMSTSGEKISWRSLDSGIP
jgi:hypothetical protein